MMRKQVKLAKLVLSIKSENHFVEEFLDELRQRDETIGEHTVNWLLEISDIFAQWRVDIKEDNDLTKVKYSLLNLPDLDDKT